MALTTGFISNAFGKDIGDVFHPISGLSPVTDTGLLTNSQAGDDLASLFMPIADGYGTSTMSGFHSDAHGGDDISLLFAIEPLLAVTVAATDALCEFSGTNTCCTPGSIYLTTTVSGGFSPYTYSWSSITEQGGYTVTGGTTSSQLEFSTNTCLAPGIYTCSATVTVKDSKNNQISASGSCKGTSKKIF